MGGEGRGREKGGKGKRITEHDWRSEKGGGGRLQRAGSEPTPKTIKHPRVCPGDLSGVRTSGRRAVPR